MEVEDERMLVTWRPPMPTHGILQAYEILYRATEGTQPEQSILITDTTQTSRWIDGLQPFTRYQVQVKNNALKKSFSIE